eukprot:4289463-Amphidinium_carterae.1
MVNQFVLQETDDELVLSPAIPGSIESHHQEQLVCLQRLPVVVYDGVQLCGLDYDSSFCGRHAHRRTIREQVVTVCCDCVTAHPKQVPKTQSRTFFEDAAVPCITTAGEKRRGVCSLLGGMPGRGRMTDRRKRSVTWLRGK